MMGKLPATFKDMLKNLFFDIYDQSDIHRRLVIFLTYAIETKIPKLSQNPFSITEVLPFLTIYGGTVALIACVILRYRASL
jgi:hypothetical protein